MKSKQFVKSWAIALLLPVFSVVVATAAVALQDQQFRNQENGAATQTQTSKIPATEIEWRRIQFQDDVQSKTSILRVPNTNRSVNSNTNHAVAEISEEHSGWNTASASGANRLSKELRASWVSLDENGILRGSVRTIRRSSDGRVAVLKNGRLIASTSADQNGNFSIEGLSPGSYTLVGYGQNHFVATGFIALAFNPSANHATSIDVLAASRQDLVISELIKEHAPQIGFRVYKLYKAAQSEEGPQRLYGVEGLTNNHLNSVPSNSIQHQPVQLRAGRMIGRLHQLDPVTARPIDLRDTTIHLIQDGHVVATTQIDQYGVFEFTDLSPGFYGLFAASKDGLGIVGVELVGETSRDANLDASYSNDATLVSYEASTANTQDVFDMTLTTPDSTGWINSLVSGQLQEEQEEEDETDELPPVVPNAQPNFLPGDLPPDAFFGGGNFGGGDFGGGGFGLGFDGAANFAFPFGLGVILIDAIDDNDGALPPASPFFN